MKIISNIPESDLPRVVIVGGGFAGMKLAGKLCRKNFQVVLIDRHNYHQFQPLYYQVATAGLEPSSIAFPIRKAFQNYKNAHFRMAELIKVYTDKKQIETNIGFLNYDFLVLAIGADNNFFGMKEMESQSLPMKSVGEALRIRNTILENYEKALNVENEIEQLELINIVIVGGGATGVELAGALTEMRRYVLPKDYPEMDFSKMNIYLIESGNRLLAAMKEDSSIRVHNYLKSMGVKIRTGRKVLSFKNKRVIMDKGDDIPAEIVLWTAGIKIPEIDGIKEAEILQGGRIRVNRFNQVLPYTDIFAVGDMCLMSEPAYPNGHPQIAPPAIQQASCLAGNLEKIISGKPMNDFSYRHKGSMATVGRNRAVVELGRIHFHGFVAWAFWLFVHLMSIVGSKNRIFIFMNWMWNYLSYDQSLRLIIRPSGKKGT